MKPETSDLFQIFSHPIRLRIMERLRSRPLTTQQIADKVDLDPTAVNGHITVLRNVGLLITERRGRPAYHRVDVERMRSALVDFCLSVGLFRGRSTAE